MDNYGLFKIMMTDDMLLMIGYKNGWTSNFIGLLKNIRS